MVFLSSSCVKNDSVLYSIEKLSKISKNIELSGGNKYEDDLLLKIKKLKDDGYNFLVHSYFPVPKDDFVLNFADTSNKTRDFICESMKYVNNLDIEYYSIHGGFKKNFNISNEFLVDGTSDFGIRGIKENIEWFYSNFSDKKLAFENLYPNNKNNVCFGNTYEEIEEILSLDNRLFLLLDLGHLKVSSRLLKFDYCEAVKKIFENYGDRIIEIHLSENGGEFDDHKAVLSDSVQYFIIDKYKEIIKKHKINLTIEARSHKENELVESFEMISKKIGEIK